MFERFPFVDVAFGPGQVHKLAEFLTSDSLTAQGYFEFEGFAGDLPEKRAREFQGWLQISVGCNMVCSYCIVPSTRGREVSRPLAALVAEVERMAVRGRHRGHAARAERQRLRPRPAAPRRAGARASPSCWRAVDAVDGIERIRYTSPHPQDMKEDVIRAHAELPALCEHVHLPLQSGSSRVLKAMRRTYTRERYLDRVALLREHVPDVAITTDIIVGFPGETEEDFAQTLSLCEQVAYDGAFTFVFSPRRGTEAATLPDQVPHPVKVERMERLVEVDPAARERARAALRRAHASRCSSRARRAPTRRGCAAARATTRPSTSAASRSRASTCRSRSRARRARRWRARSRCSRAPRGERRERARPAGCDRGLVIFDCDGVLVDSMAIVMRELTRALARGRRDAERGGGRRGVPRLALADIERGVEAHLGRPLPDGWIERFLAERAAAFERELRPVAGRGRGDRRRARRRLGGVHRLRRAHGEDGADAARRRPARRVPGRPHLLARRWSRAGSRRRTCSCTPPPRAAIAPAACVVVEDSVPGVTAGRAAGMRTFGYADGDAAHAARLAALGAEPLAALLDAAGALAR